MDITPHQLHKKKKGICVTPFCVKPRGGKCITCWSCQKKEYQKNNPILYAYQTLKNNARRRGKEFTLTIECFTSFVVQNDYMNKKGTRSKSLQIDRIDESKGYHDDNIQAITLRENVYKYRKSKMDMGEAPF